MTRPLSTVIFDCDGVLVDSEHLANLVVARMVQPYTHGYDADYLARRFTGRTTAETVQVIEREKHMAFPPNFLETVEDAIDHALRHEVEAVPGVHEMLSALTAPTAIASNSTRNRVLASLTRTDLVRFFDDRIASAEEVERPKPAPDVYHLATRRYVPDPTHALVVEDSPTGTAAARAAGLEVIGFLGASGIPPGQSDALIRAGADRVVTTMAELTDVFQQRCR